MRVDWPACRARGLRFELLPEAVALDDWGYPIVAGEIRTGWPPPAKPSAPAPGWALRLRS